MVVLTLLFFTIINFASGGTFSSKVMQLNSIGNFGFQPWDEAFNFTSTITETVDKEGCNGGLILFVSLQDVVGLNATTVTNYIVQATTNTIISHNGEQRIVRKNNDFISIYVNNEHRYLTNSPPPDAIEFFGIPGSPKVICSKAEVNQTKVGWSVELDTDYCRDLPQEWGLLELQYNLPKAEIAKRLLIQSDSVNVVDCTRFNDIDKSTVTLIVGRELITL